MTKLQLHESIWWSLRLLPVFMIRRKHSHAVAEWAIKRSGGLPPYPLLAEDRGLNLVGTLSVAYFVAER